MAWLRPAPSRPSPSASTAKVRLTVAISILRLKPAHLNSLEFLSFLQQVIPVNTRLKDVNPIHFYRQLATFSSSTLLELKLELLEAKANIGKEETFEPLQGGHAQNSKKRKIVKEPKQTSEGSTKKQKSEPSKAYRPLPNLKPYAPLIQGTPALQKAICILRSHPTPATFIEGLEVLIPFFTNELPKLWIDHTSAHPIEDAKSDPKNSTTKQAPKQGLKVPIGSVGVLYKAIDSLVKLVLQSIDGLSSLISDSEEGQAICLSSLSLFWAIVGCVYQNSVSVIYARTSNSNHVLDIRNGLVECLIVVLSRLRPTESIQRTILEGLIAMLLDSASIFMFFPTGIHGNSDSKTHELDYGKKLWEEAGRHFLRLLNIAISAMETRVLSRGRQSCQPWLLNARERLQERLSAAVVASIKQEDTISKRRDMTFKDFSSDINGDYVDEVWALLGIEAVASSTPDPCTPG